MRVQLILLAPIYPADTAHQIINTGSTTMRYLSLSKLCKIEVCEYPDSNKVGVHADEPAPGLHKIFRAGSAVEYYDRESTHPRPSDA